ncbi:hypothetical protein [Planomonospora sp. ID82291]|uniref:hypothetical protein n=1 Tax=Planomonospora sp. ID82291 TaxID=2738136 RepID=UPI0018C38F9F|nr:hypothetical protein [Planomonospora sp. ID82291]MBG0812643.1 hypothetical protein [Planomonospora sp. ID82291]
MVLVSRDDVRTLLDSPDPGATLVLVEGRCAVLPEDRAEGLVIASRRDLASELDGADRSDRELDRLAGRLDGIARDLGA